MDIKKYISAKKILIDKALDKYLPPSTRKPQIIHKAMRYAIFPGGKRIRPIFTIAGFEACGGRGSSIMPVACAIELIHTYTLIHDDLPCMDNDDLRRGKPTCHKKFNEYIALLTGDALLTLAFQVLSKAGNADIVNEISKAVGTYGTIGGQVSDIENPNGDLDYIASHKTGALFEAAVKAGALFKRAGKPEINSLAKFGAHIGLTFQLIDDLIDKDGYVRRFGAMYVEKKAASLTDKGKHYLEPFGKNGKILSGLADFILHRNC